MQNEQEKGQEERQGSRDDGDKKAFDVALKEECIVDELEEAVIVLYNSTDSVSCNTGGRLDDTYHLPSQCIQQTAFAHIWTADNSNCWY